MIFTVVSPEIVSVEPFEETKMEGLFIDADKKTICLIEGDVAYAILLE